jgi:hypothetical protein
LAELLLVVLVLLPETEKGRRLKYIKQLFFYYLL